MRKGYTRGVATHVVIANMIGTGIFTTLGFQVMDDAIPDPAAILFVWLLGGVLALAGATCYAEVASVYPEDGGEYHFLSRLYHPVIGITSGVVSIITGFSAAIAGLGYAAAAYLSPLLPQSVTPALAAASLVAAMGLVQWFGIQVGSTVQVALTTLKLITLGFILSLPAWMELPHERLFSLTVTDRTWDLLFSPAVPQSLVWVMFAYSGWNAATYIVGHLNDPKKDLAPALLQGTTVVTVLYILLTYVFMRSAPFEQLAGQIEVGNLVVASYLGDGGLRTFGALVALSLAAGLNAMFIAGPRVIQKMAEDLKLFPSLSREHDNGSPRQAVALLTSVALFFVLFGSFKDLVEYISVSLTLFSMLVVAGVFVVRWRGLHSENTIRSLAYPLSPILFLVSGAWIVFFFASEDPAKLLWTALTLIPGIAIYFLSGRSTGVHD